MDDDCLSAWIRDATDIVNERKLKLSPTEPSLTNLSPSEFITIPYNYKNGFRYSFVRYGDCQSALPTAELVLKARKFYRNSKFLSASIELARRCPHLVLPVQPPNEYQLNNLDCLKSLMAFLSYGFYDISRQRKWKCSDFLVIYYAHFSITTPTHLNRITSLPQTTPN